MKNRHQWKSDTKPGLVFENIESSNNKLQKDQIFQAISPQQCLEKKGRHKILKPEVICT